MTLMPVPLEHLLAVADGVERARAGRRSRRCAHVRSPRTTRQTPDEAQVGPEGIVGDGRRRASSSARTGCRPAAGCCRPRSSRRTRRGGARRRGGSGRPGRPARAPARRAPASLSVSATPFSSPKFGSETRTPSIRSRWPSNRSAHAGRRRTSRRRRASSARARRARRLDVQRPRSSASRSCRASADELVGKEVPVADDDAEGALGH